MEPFSYIQYALTNFCKKVGVPFPHGTAPGLMALLFSLDFLGLYVLLSEGKINMNYVWIAFAIIYTLTYVFFGEKNYKKKEVKYLHFSKNKKLIANGCVTIFVILSIYLCYYTFNF